VYGIFISTKTLKEEEEIPTKTREARQGKAARTPYLG